MTPRYLKFILPMLACLAQGYIRAAVIIEDHFDTGSTTTGAAALPGNEWLSGGASKTQNQDGTLTFSTSGGPSQWNTAVLYTNVPSPELNIFRNTVTMSIRGLDIQGFGDHANPNSRFRIGLMPRDNEVYTAGSVAQGGNSFNQFYNNGNDGLSLSLRTTAAGLTSFDFQYKTNAAQATDPNTTPTLGSSTLTFLANHFDFTVNSTQWSIHFWNDTGDSEVKSGTLPLGDKEGTWGNAVDGWGNAAFIMGIQNMGANNVSAPTDAANGYMTSTIDSIVVTSVPEPARAFLAIASLSALGFLRRRF